MIEWRKGEEGSKLGSQRLNIKLSSNGYRRLGKMLYVVAYSAMVIHEYIRRTICEKSWL